MQPEKTPMALVPARRAGTVGLARSLAIGGAIAAAVAAAAVALAAGTHPVTGEALADDQTFTYRLLDQFPTLDPQLNQDVSGFHVIRDLFEGLLSQDASGKLVPGVATGYTASNGNTTYTFTLREDARWSNGDPVTAHDFVYAWRRAVDPDTASPYAWYLELTGMVNARAILAGELAPAELGVRAVDDRTLEVKLHTPLPYFPAMTTYATLFPAHRATIEAHDARLDGAREHGLERRLRARGGGAQRVPLAGREPDVLGRGRRDHREGHRPRHQRRPTRRSPDTARASSTTSSRCPPGQYPALKEALPDEATSVPRLCSYYYAINHTASGEPRASGRAGAARARHGHRP